MRSMSLRASRKKASSLPRPLTPNLEVPAIYRAGMYAELQKFGSSERDLQLTLWQEADYEEPVITVSGLELTVLEDKALSAIQILLDQTGYAGNDLGQTIDSRAYQWRGELPRLAITYTDYFEAYGLDRASDGRYHGKQVQEALEALRSLAETKRAIYYKRTHHKGGQKLSDIVRIKAPLISLKELTAWQDLDAEEAEQVLAGQEVDGKIRVIGLLIEISPLLVDQIDSFYLLKPTTLHREIQDCLGRKRPSRCISLFIQWLLTKNSARVRISKQLLAQRLRMSKEMKQRHWNRIEARLGEAIQIAIKLGYLLDFKEEPPGMYTFWLNAKRCFRVQSQETGTEQEEEMA